MEEHDTVRKVDPNGEALVWCRTCSGCARCLLGPKMMDRCTAEKREHEQAWKDVKTSLSDVALQELLNLQTLPAAPPLCVSRTVDVSLPRANFDETLADGGAEPFRGGTDSRGTRTRSLGDSHRFSIRPSCSNTTRLVKPFFIDVTFGGIAEALPNAAECICHGHAQKRSSALRCLSSTVQLPVVLCT